MKRTTLPGVMALASLAAVGPLAFQAARASDPAAGNDEIRRGEYLVTIMACHDCHTPFAMTPRGPEPDMTRMLSGHPQDIRIAEPPKLGDGAWTEFLEIKAHDKTDRHRHRDGERPPGIVVERIHHRKAETGQRHDDNEEDGQCRRRTGHHSQLVAGDFRK